MIRLHVLRGTLGEGQRHTVELHAGDQVTLRALLERAREFLPQSTTEVEVGLNGRQLPDDADLDQVVPDGSEVIVATATTGPVLAFVLYAVAMAAASVAINYLMQLLVPRPKPPGVPQDRGEQASQTYAWDGIQTNFGHGLPVPWVYGRHAVGGQVIYTDVFASTAGTPTTDELRLVLALGEGPIAAVGDTPIDELDDLDPIPTEIRVNENLLGSETAETVLDVQTSAWTSGQPSGVGEVLRVLNGAVEVGSLQIVDHDQATSPGFQRFDAVRITGTVTVGNTLRNFSGGTATVSQFAQVVRPVEVPAAQVWLRPGTLDQRELPAPFEGASTTFSPNASLSAENEESVQTYGGSEELRHVGFVFSFPAGLYRQDPQGNLAPFQIVLELRWRPVGTQTWRLFFANSGVSMPLTTAGASPSFSPITHFVAARLARNGDPAVSGPIEVRVRRVTPATENTVSQCVWRNLSVASPHTFSYPGTALMGLVLRAGARFSGGLPNIVTRIDGLLVRVWDAELGFSPRTWKKFTSGGFAFSLHDPGRNPAWICADFLTNKHGLGRWLTDDDLDWASFRRWAAFCDMDPSPLSPWSEPAFCCDLVGDQPRPAWEWVLAICAAGRAAPIYRNGKIGVVYQYRDAHADLGIDVAEKAPVQLITSSNCEKVTTTWLPKQNRATVFDFQFLNEDELYRQDVLPVADDEGSLDDPTQIGKDQARTEPIQAYGVTRPSQIFREGRFRHRVQRLIRREIAFVTGRWALALEVGDLFEFEHDLMRPFGADVPTSMSIRVGGTDVTQVTVDHAAVGPSQIVIRDGNGAPQKRAIEGATLVDGGKHTRYDLNVAVTCSAGAACVVGLDDKLTEVYECVAITLQKDGKREVRAVQWVPEVHDPITPSEYAGIGNDTLNFLQPPAQDGVEAPVGDVRVVAQRDGGHLICWGLVANRVGFRTRVYVRAVGAEAWTLVGATEADRIAWLGFLAFQAYEVSVCPENVGGTPPQPDQGTIVGFTPEEFPPHALPSVSNVRSVALDDELLVQWDDLDQRDLDYYELRAGSCWAAGQVLHRGRAPRVTLANPAVGVSYMIAPRSTSGLYGEVALHTPAAWAPPFTAQALSEDDFSPSPAGTHTGTAWNSGAGYIELQAGALTGTYESAVQDLGYQGPFYWQVRIGRAEVENTTVDELDFEVDSGEARWRQVDGRPASACKPGVDWQTRVDDLTMTIDDLPDNLLVQGHVGEIGSHSRVLVETRFEVGGSFTPYREHADRRVVARKMQVRLTFDRESLRYEPRATLLTYAAYI